jgi:hypothetical protein
MGINTYRTNTPVAEEVRYAAKRRSLSQQFGRASVPKCMQPARLIENILCIHDFAYSGTDVCCGTVRAVHCDKYISGQADRPDSG